MPYLPSCRLILVISILSVEIAEASSISNAPHQAKELEFDLQQWNPLTNALRHYVIIAGEVKSPGYYGIATNRPCTISAAIGFAGGLNWEADSRHVELIREHEQSQIINYAMALTNKNSDLPVFDRDLILIRALVPLGALQRTNRIYRIVSPSTSMFIVSGEVAKPGEYFYAPMDSLSLLDGIERAGGVKRVADLSRVTVFRTRRRIMRVDLSGNTTNAHNNMLIEQLDRVHVPRRFPYNLLEPTVER